MTYLGIVVSYRFSIATIEQGHQNPKKHNHWEWTLVSIVWYV